MKATNYFDQYKKVYTSDVFVIFQEHLLLLKRSPDKKVFPNVWVVPGGHVEQNESHLDCAMRELEEETGIVADSRCWRLVYIAKHRHIDRLEEYNIFGFAVDLKEKPNKVKITKEGQLQWVKISEIDHLDQLFPPIKHYLENILSKERKLVFNVSTWEKAQLVDLISQESI